MTTGLVPYHNMQDKFLVVQFLYIYIVNSNQIFVQHLYTAVWNRPAI